VVAEHEERPVPGRQRLERRDVGRQPRHRPVHDVAGQRDEIRRESFVMSTTRWTYASRIVDRRADR